ncbi:unnamed protein product [Allacma fusca]|uniref:Uncharacterized protein n=1 Tax=Allacma fusca TaxID=39272 RepID=A0A8J2JQG6_9HEXA|nr:unnamed protein product [Allacma fusca]
MKTTLVGLAIAFGFASVFLSLHGIHAENDEEADLLDEEELDDLRRDVRRVLNDTAEAAKSMQEALREFYGKKFKWYASASMREYKKAKATTPKPPGPPGQPNPTPPPANPSPP